MHTLHGDGNNLEESFRLASEAVARARAGEGPTFVLLDTYRWREHCGPNFDNHIGYRTEAEYLEWETRCPLRALRRRIGEALSADDEKAMTAEITAEIEAARAFARAAPLPGPDQASRFVYA